MRKPIPIFSGAVDSDGKLHLEARSLMTRYLQTLKNSVVSITIRKQGRPKSRSQLGYLYGVVYPIAAEHFGYMEYEIDALHDAIMRQLRGLKPEPNPLGLRVSLAEMEHEQVSGYIEDLRHWLLVEHGVETPDAQKVEAA